MKKHVATRAPEIFRFAVLAADTALFTIRDRQLYTRLISVNRPPHYINALAMPGGLLKPSETAEEAAHRHLYEKTAITSGPPYMEQLCTLSGINRDPRGRVVSVAYLALVSWDSLSAEERLDTATSEWHLVKDTPPLAYDHDELLKTAVTRLRSRVTYTTLIAKLLPKEFTLTELEQTYECVLKSSLDKRNFRKKVLKLNIIRPTGKKKSTGRSRPAELYRFISPKVTEIEVL